MFGVNTKRALPGIEKLLIKNSVFHVVVVMMHMALFGYELVAIDL